MSLNQPIPNNLALVKFAAPSVDFTVSGPITFGTLEYDEQEFTPTISTVIYRNAAGTFSTPAVVAIDNGTTGQNIATGTLAATPVVAINGTGALSQTILTNASNGYVLGKIPVANPNPSASATNAGGAATVQSIRLNISTAAIPSLATTNRVTVGNISTLTVAAVPSWLTAGASVSVLTVGNAGYNGMVTVISTTSTTFSYYNPTVTTEASTADTAGRVGVLVGDVYVYGYLR